MPAGVAAVGGCAAGVDVEGGVDEDEEEAGAGAVDESPEQPRAIRSTPLNKANTICFMVSSLKKIGRGMIVEGRVEKKLPGAGVSGAGGRTFWRASPQ